LRGADQLLVELVGAADGEPFAVRREGDGIHLASPGELMNLPPRLGIPEAHGLVVAGCGQGAAVGRIGDGVYPPRAWAPATGPPAGVGRPAAQLFAGGCVPEMHAAEVRGGDHTAVRGKNGALRAGAVEGEPFAPRGDVPELHLPTVTAAEV